MRRTWMMLRCDGCQMLIRWMRPNGVRFPPEHHDDRRGFLDGCGGELWAVCTRFGDESDLLPELRGTSELHRYRLEDAT